MSDSRVLGDDLGLAFDRAGPDLTVHLSGVLDRSTGPGALRQVEDHLAGVAHLVLDVADLTYLDAGGLHFVRAVHDRVAEIDGCQLLVVEPVGIVDRVLQASGLDQVVAVAGRRGRDAG